MDGIGGEEGRTHGEVSKKLMPRRKAWRTAASASSSETRPKTLPSGEAPKPTQLRSRPVRPSGRRSTTAGGAIGLLRVGEGGEVRWWGRRKEIYNSIPILNLIIYLNYIIILINLFVLFTVFIIQILHEPTSQERPEQKKPLSEAIHVPPPQPTPMAFVAATDKYTQSCYPCILNSCAAVVSLLYAHAGSLPLAFYSSRESNSAFQRRVAPIFSSPLSYVVWICAASCNIKLASQHSHL